MTLPAFATVEQFALRVPDGVDTEDAARAQAALEDASTLIRAEAAKDWVTDGELDADVPDVIVMVCIAAARRAFVNPDGVTSEQFDAFQQSFGSASGDVYLNKNEKALVRKAAGLRSGLWVLPTTRGYLETRPVQDLNGAPERTYPDASEYTDVDGGEPAVYNGDEP